MDGMQLMDVSAEKDLGVVVSQDLKWEKQYSAVLRVTNMVLRILTGQFANKPARSQSSCGLVISKFSTKHFCQ